MLVERSVAATFRSVHVASVSAPRSPPRPAGRGDIHGRGFMAASDPRCSCPLKQRSNCLVLPDGGVPRTSEAQAGLLYGFHPADQVTRHFVSSPFPGGFAAHETKDDVVSGIRCGDVPARGAPTLDGHNRRDASPIEEPPPVLWGVTLRQDSDTICSRRVERNPAGAYQEGCALAVRQRCAQVGQSLRFVVTRTEGGGGFARYIQRTNETRYRMREPRKCDPACC